MRDKARQARPEPGLRIVLSGDSLQVVGNLDRRLAERLALELRTVVRRRGLEVRSVSVLPDEPPAAGLGSIQ